VSRERLHEHRRIWEQKPVLAAVYAPWFDALLAALPDSGIVIEVGAGPGFLAAHARRHAPRLQWVATDVVGVPWNDVAADALRLPVRRGSIAAVVGLDVVHHLADPARFFEEAAAALAPGGCVAVLEPWVTPLSYPVYRWLHQEGCRPGRDPWRPFGDARAKDAFDGDNGIFTNLVRSAGPERWRSLGLQPPRVTLINGLAYLLSLGFRERSLLPRPLVPLFTGLDRATRGAARLLGFRALAVWERSTG